MCPSTLACQLCLCTGSELKALVNENGQKNEIYEVAVKYFDPVLLTTAMCVTCWQHIDEFHEFQQSVFNAQAKICEIDIGPLVKLETVLMTRNNDAEKLEPLVKLEPVTIHQDDDDDNLSENMNIPINDSADSIDCNPFSSDDDIPLTKYSETSKSCITSKEETLSDSDSKDDNGMLLTEYSTTNELSVQSKENVSEHNTSHAKQNYNCPYCPRKYGFKQSIRRHIKILHPKKISEYSNNESKHFEHGFQCPYCPKKMKIKRSVRRHIKNIHTKEYFASLDNMSKHNEQAFQCPYCTTKFKAKTNIRRHIKHLHPKEFIEYSINPPTIIQVTLNSNSILLNDEFSKTNVHSGDSKIIIKTLNESIENVTSEEEIIDINHHNDTTVSNNDSSESIIENLTPKLESIDVDHQNDTTKQAYLCPCCPAQIKAKENVSLHIKKLHPQEFVEYHINQPKIIQVDLESNSSFANNAVSENNESSVLANKNLRRNKNINNSVDSTDCNPLSSDNEDIPLTNYANASKLWRNSKEETLDINQCTQSVCKFKCNICGKKFKREKNLREHTATHAEKTYQCLHCTKKFNVKNYLRLHILNVHSTVLAQYQCDYCPSKFKLKESVRRHVKKFHPKEFIDYSKTKSKHFKINPPLDSLLNSIQDDSKCSICSKVFKTSNGLRQHMKYKHTGYQCRHCPKTFQEKKDLDHHFQHFHPTEFEIFSDYDGFVAKWEKELECYVCKNKFANFSLLNKHFEVEHPKDKCHILCCGLKLSYRLALVEHIRFHLDPSFFTCKVCGKSELSGRYLRLHMRKHINDPQFQCKICKKYFMNNSKLLLHSGIHMTEKHHKCKVCGKGFSTELLQKKHELNYHRERRLCDQCGKSFYNLNSLKQHQLVHDGIERSTDGTERPVTATLNLPCEICGSVFKTHGTLNTHKKAFHVDDSKAYVCSVCGKMYASEINLNSHKQIVHTANRFKCTICDKEFKYPQSFRIHKTTHNLKTRIRCPHCTSRFTQKENFYRHLKIYHPPEYAKVNRRKKSKADFSSVKETIVI